VFFRQHFLGALVELLPGAHDPVRADSSADDARAALVAWRCCPRAVLGVANTRQLLGHQVARTWALELASEGITVNVVAPRLIRNDMFYDVVDAGNDKERACHVGARAAAGRADRSGERCAFCR
jgi:hypothetical protein